MIGPRIRARFFVFGVLIAACAATLLGCADVLTASPPAALTVVQDSLYVADGGLTGGVRLRTVDLSSGEVGTVVDSVGVVALLRGHVVGRTHQRPLLGDETIVLVDRLGAR